MRSDNKYRLITILLVLILSGSYLSALSQDPKDAYNDGVEFYSSEKYEEAIIIWEKLISSGYTSADLYYNLGNANFNNASIPGAILYYEKALLLKPFNEDIRYNLEIARTYVTDSFQTIPELFIVRWFKMVSLMIHSNAWAIISLVLFVFTLGLILVYLFSVKIGLKKLSFVLALFALLLSIVSLSLSYQNTILINKKQYAIIFEPAVTGKSSPDESGKDLFLIHEGTKVRVEDEIGEWYEVRLSDGNVGWIPSESIVKV